MCHEESSEQKRVPTFVLANATSSPAV